MGAYKARCALCALPASHTSVSLLLSGAQAQPKKEYISWDKDKQRVLLTQVAATDSPFHNIRCGKYNQQLTWSDVINSDWKETKDKLDIERLKVEASIREADAKIQEAHARSQEAQARTQELKNTEASHNAMFKFMMMKTQKE